MTESQLKIININTNGWLFAIDKCMRLHFKNAIPRQISQPDRWIKLRRMIFATVAFDMT